MRPAERIFAVAQLTYRCSIRLIFSIADLQTEQEAEFEEGEEAAEENAEDAEAPLHSYPIRCSFSFTKVRSPLIPPSFENSCPT